MDDHHRRGGRRGTFLSAGSSPSIRGKGRHSIQVRQLLLLLLLLVGVSRGCHGVGGCRRRRCLRWQVAAGRGGSRRTGVSASTTSAPATSGECHLQPWDLQQPAVRLSALAAGAVALGQRAGVSLHVSLQVAFLLGVKREFGRCLCFRSSTGRRTVFSQLT